MYCAGMACTGLVQGLDWCQGTTLRSGGKGEGSLGGVAVSIKT